MKHDMLQYLTEIYPRLTEGEKRIADTIAARPDAALTLTIKELAAQAGVSTATVSRFAAHLGCSSYKELQIKLARQGGTQDDDVLNIENATHTKEQLETLAQAHKDTISLTLSALDDAAIEACATLLHEAKRILFFGLGTSFVTGEDAAMKFARLGKTALAVRDSHTAAVHLSAFDTKDILVAISHSGETDAVCRVLALAKRKGARTVLLCTYPTSRAASLAEHTLTTVTREIPRHRMAFTSRISQLFLLDALFLATLSKDPERHLSSIESVREDISSL